MTIDQTETLKVARLARLELTSEEAEQYSQQLSQVLDCFDQLDQVNTTGITQLSHPLDITNVFAEDVVAPSLPREEVLQNAPKQDGECYNVPAVIKAT